MAPSTLAETRRVLQAERAEKKIREAEMLRHRTPEETLLMGFQLMWFARLLSEAEDA